MKNKFNAKSFLSILALSAVIMCCNRKSSPQITYQEEQKTIFDTITMDQSGVLDTIWSSVPCDSFVRYIKANDTVYMRTVVKGEVHTKLVTKHDTVFRTPIITPQPIKVKRGDVTIGDNNTNNKTKKGDAITGDGNTIKKTANNRFWLGVCVATGILYLLGIGMFVLGRYVPPAAPVAFIIKKFLPGGI